MFAVIETYKNQIVYLIKQGIALNSLVSSYKILKSFVKLHLQNLLFENDKMQIFFKKVFI